MAEKISMGKGKNAISLTWYVSNPDLKLKIGNDTSKKYSINLPSDIDLIYNFIKSKAEDSKEKREALMLLDKRRERMKYEVITKGKGPVYSEQCGRLFESAFINYLFILLKKFKQVDINPVEWSVISKRLQNDIKVINKTSLADSQKILQLAQKNAQTFLGEHPSLTGASIQGVGAGSEVGDLLLFFNNIEKGIPLEIKYQGAYTKDIFSWRPSEETLVQRLNLGRTSLLGYMKNVKGHWHIGDAETWLKLAKKDATHLALNKGEESFLKRINSGPQTAKEWLTFLLYKQQRPVSYRHPILTNSAILPNGSLSFEFDAVELLRLEEIKYNSPENRFLTEFKAKGLKIADFTLSRDAVQLLEKIAKEYDKAYGDNGNNIWNPQIPKWPATLTYWFKINTDNVYNVLRT